MRPSRRLSGDESDSGVNKVTTRSGPSARAHRNATTLLSMPPETPITAPCRFNCLYTTSRIRSEIRSTSAAGSIFKISLLMPISVFTRSSLMLFARSVRLCFPGETRKRKHR